MTIEHPTLLHLPAWLRKLAWSTSAVPVLARLLAFLLVTQWLAYRQLWPADGNQQSTLLYLALVYLAKTALLVRLESFPGGRSAIYRLAILAGIFALGFSCILALRLGYARSSLFLGMGLILAAELVSSWIRGRLEVEHYLLVPPVQPPASLPANVHCRVLVAPEPATGVLVVESEAAMSEVWLRHVVLASMDGQKVLSAQALRERLSGQVDVGALQPGELDISPSLITRCAKRLLDLLLVLVLLPFAVVASLAVALIIRIESPGAAIFSQKRVGEDGRPFTMYKFRSMREERRHAPRFASDESDRITRFGYFIRATHLDELPQLFNVLIGNMSFVGPRPEQQAFVEKFREELPFYDLRHRAKPGITGWAQVCQGYAADTASTREKLAYDLFYLKHQSLWLDILILARTLRSVILDRHPMAK